MTYIDNTGNVSRTQFVDAEGKILPLGILVYSNKGGGKTLASEEIEDYYRRHGYTTISLSDVKDSLEQAFTIFDPKTPYHIRKLREYGCPTGKIPTKIYHPFTFGIPKNKLPEIEFFTINIKNIGRMDLQFLAESSENKKSIQILLETIKNIKNDEGLHHLIFYAENQTESMANITKSSIRLRSEKPDDFFTKSKIGTEKTSGEITSYFKPFIQDYAITPANCEYNLDIIQIMNDQKHHHVFTYKWIQDERLKAFFVFHILDEIVKNLEDHAKHPIMLIIEEVGVLVPQKTEGFVKYIAEELNKNLKKIRNMGKGCGCIMTTQIYRDTNELVIDTCDEQLIGKITSLKEYKFIGDALRLKTNEIELLKSIQVGEFVVRAKQQYSTDTSLQKIRLWMPPHNHKEVGYNFFEIYEHTYPEKMQRYETQTTTMKTIKERIEEEVMILAEKENQDKKMQLKQEKEERMDKEKMRMKIEMAKIQKKTEKTEDIDDKLKEAIYARYKETTGKEHSTRNIARYFKLFLTDGSPNHKAIQRAIAYIQKKHTKETENNDDKKEIAETSDETKDVA